MSLNRVRSDIQGIPSPPDQVPTIPYVGTFGFWTRGGGLRTPIVRVFKAKPGRTPTMGFIEGPTITVIWGPETASLPFSHRYYIQVLVPRPHPDMLFIMRDLEDAGFDRFGWIESSNPDNSMFLLWRSLSGPDIAGMTIEQRNFYMKLGGINQTQSVNPFRNATP